MVKAYTASGRITSPTQTRQDAWQAVLEILTKIKNTETWCEIFFPGEENVLIYMQNFYVSGPPTWWCSPTRRRIKDYLLITIARTRVAVSVYGHKAVNNYYCSQKNCKDVFGKVQTFLHRVEQIFLIYLIEFLTASHQNIHVFGLYFFSAMLFCSFNHPRYFPFNDNGLNNLSDWLAVMSMSNHISDRFLLCVHLPAAADVEKSPWFVRQSLLCKKVSGAFRIEYALNFP